MFLISDSDVCLSLGILVGNTLHRDPRRYDRPEETSIAEFSEVHFGVTECLCSGFARCARCIVCSYVCSLDFRSKTRGRENSREITPTTDFTDFNRKVAQPIRRSVLGESSLGFRNRDGGEGTLQDGERASEYLSRECEIKILDPILRADLGPPSPSASVGFSASIVPLVSPDSPETFGPLDTTTDILDAHTHSLHRDIPREELRLGREAGKTEVGGTKGALSPLTWISFYFDLPALEAAGDSTVPL
ncbi:hypothetical protein KM043_012471 [Ampulex compressa]|nr:hypothetical protein KM043_012471 [Ampulex compressa]